MYAEGPFYLMSTDLCAMVAKVGSKGLGVAAEGHEDHDVSAMAFMGLDKYPIRLVPIPKVEHPSKFFKHGVKLDRLGWTRTQSYFETETKRATHPSIPHYVDSHSPEEIRKAKRRQEVQTRLARIMSDKPKNRIVFNKCGSIVDHSDTKIYWDCIKKLPGHSTTS